MTKKTIAKPAPRDIVTAMNSTFEPWFEGESWNNWRAVLKAAYGLPISDDEREFFRSVAERDPPRKQVKQLWVCAGRRSGKDSIASLIVAHTAALFDGVPRRKKIAGINLPRLRRGERALCMCLACDRDQARIILNYVRSYFTDVPALASMVQRETRDGFELRNGVDIVVATNSFRAVRGRAILCAVLDEVAFFLDENSSKPDVELYNALTPGMATLPQSMLIGISSPHKKSGLLWKKFKAHYGREDDDVLVVKGPSIAFNPTIDRSIIDKELAEDPAAKRAEWLAEFRDDLAAFVSPEVVADSVVAGRHELLPVSGIAYIGALDPAGGSGGDSLTAAIAHRDPLSDKLTLDAVREYRPPFSPDQVLNEVAELFRRYGIRRAWGDRYAGEFPRERLRYSGVDYLLLRQSKSEIYAAFLPALNSGRVALLDTQRLISQLCGLERRTTRGARDSIDHPPGQHDDVANAAAACLVMCGENAERKVTWTVTAGDKTFSNGEIVEDRGYAGPWPRIVAPGELPPRRLEPTDAFLR
jgi:hypothetical protein